MASQQQIDANRRNARRSTGPKTPEGKAAVSQNAIRHGLTSTRAIALPEENLEEFNDLLESFSAQFQPQSPFERSLVLQMAVADWRMRRAVRLETGILAYRLDEMRAERDIPLPKPDPASSLRHSREITQVCSPKVTQLLAEERGTDAGFSDHAGRLLPMGKSWQWPAS